MKVVLNQILGSTSDGASGASATSPTPRVASPPALPQEIPADTQNTTSPGETPKGAASEDLQANITFRQDAAGQVYYVLTDPESGKELREVPPAEIRNVSEGIADYLKQEATKATSRVKIKA